MLGKMVQFSEAGLGSSDFSGVSQATVILLMFLAVFMYKNMRMALSSWPPCEHLTDVSTQTSLV